MYQSRYSFWDEKKFPGFQEAMQNLYNRSVQYYYKNNMNGNVDLATKKADLKKIGDFCSALEYYYVSLIKLGIVTKQNYGNVLYMLSHIDTVRLFFEKKQEIYAITNGGNVSVNTKGIHVRNFSTDVSFQMIVSHELGHIINNSWLEDARAVSKYLFYDRECHEMLKRYGFDDLKNIFFGFILIDEGVSQECAERVTYREIHEKRPPYVWMKKPKVLSESAFLTNFNLYEEFQEIVVKFAKCLHFVGCSQTDDFNEVLEKLAKKSFRRDFIFQIWKEIKDDSEKKCDFALMLACMGKIKDGSYANFGMGDKKSNQNITSFLNSFNYLADHNKCLTDVQNKQKIMSKGNNCGIFV